MFVTQAGWRQRPSEISTNDDVQTNNQSSRTRAGTGNVVCCVHSIVHVTDAAETPQKQSARRDTAPQLGAGAEGLCGWGEEEQCGGGGGVMVMKVVVAGGGGVHGGESRLSGAAGRRLEWPVSHQLGLERGAVLWGEWGGERRLCVPGRRRTSPPPPPPSELHCSAQCSAARRRAAHRLLLLTPPSAASCSRPAWRECSEGSWRQTAHRIGDSGMRRMQVLSLAS